MVNAAEGSTADTGLRRSTKITRLTGVEMEELNIPRKVVVVSGDSVTLNHTTSSMLSPQHHASSLAKVGSLPALERTPSSVKRSDKKIITLEQSLSRYKYKEENRGADVLT